MSYSARAKMIKRAVKGMKPKVTVTERTFGSNIPNNRGTRLAYKLTPKKLRVKAYGRRKAAINSKLNTFHSSSPQLKAFDTAKPDLANMADNVRIDHLAKKASRLRKGKGLGGLILLGAAAYSGKKVLDSRGK